ncbi:MAG: U32 family peptidase [Bacteroidales bacterium]|nr:U32 family peptidase [Bacteroidales bacterium]
MQNKMELMSPVGSYESLTAAFQGGADSIYFGVGRLNMRSRSAHNFSESDIATVASRCRERGVKCYLTLNTVVYDSEMSEMCSIVDQALRHGVSAIIASDMAVIAYCRQVGMEVHVSTQCNISNYEALRFYAQFADVAVLARELSLSAVAEISRRALADDLRGPKGEPLRLEMFAHGALCMSVSGKCYLSLDNCNTSANRGACVQLCRHAYTVCDKETGLELDVDGEYIMSPKDLCTIGFIDKMKAAGVSVLKIEGRGRSADYVRVVTECYREAIDTLAAGTYSRERVGEWTARLATVFNRGFWDGYYLGRKLGEWSDRYGSQATEQKVYLGRVTNYFNRIAVAEAKLETAETFAVGDKLMVTGDTTGVYTCVPSELRTDRGAVGQVRQGEKFSFLTSEVLHRGDKVYKVITSIDPF